MGEKKGYCVRCKRKVAMLNARPVKFKNGRPALRGTCGRCGTTVSRILAKVLPDITAFLLGATDKREG